ncbi:MAG: mechanosensitive ion channel family protein [Gemmatimonadetes bacterium]|nr:mechanosensitive ion channel family protein [Gemmatimonadota bacterium]
MEFLGFDLGQFDFQAWLDSAWAFAGPRLVLSAGQLILVLVVWLAARWILRRIEHRLTSRTKTELDDLVIQLIRRVVLISIVFWGAWRLTQIWELGHMSRTIGAVWIVALSLPISAFVSSALRVFEEKVAPKTESRLDDTALPLLNRIVRGLVVGLGVLIALTFLGINITPVLAGAGVMGLGVSLAAKDTLSNLIAGLLLIIDRPFQVGDRIELWNAPTETGSWGDVIEIGLRATKIRNPDNLIIVVPNNEIMRRDIINYTASGPHIRLRIPFGIAYDADAERAKKLVLEAAIKIEGVMADPEPVVITRGFGESSVNLELRVWITQARDRRAIGDAVGDRIKKTFDEHGIEIPFPRRDIVIRTKGGEPILPAE